MTDEQATKGKSRARNKAAAAGKPPEVSDAAKADCESKCPFSDVKKVVDWLSVVDDFKIKDHQNMLPRWAFVMIVLVFFAL